MKVESTRKKGKKIEISEYFLIFIIKKTKMIDEKEKIYMGNEMNDQMLPNSFRRFQSFIDDRKVI